jgi:transcriptional regulator with PAS, ATPase and Fis domain
MHDAAQKKNSPEGASFVGESASIRAVLERIGRIARTDAGVLIEGETGTGKELAARAIHYMSGRRDFPFIPLNCGALPDTLIENELFGHERGAFTDARSESPGMLRLAHRGTLFLDEVDSLPPRAQIVLLRFLQDHRFRPLGGRAEEFADVRIIAACNTSLETLIRSKAFRADLYYRLRMMSVLLPPLRERGGDAELLATHFIRECAKQYGMPEKRLHPATVRWIRAYNWPGNVRELQNFIQSEFLLSDNAEIATQVCEASIAEHAPREDQAPLPYAHARSIALEEFDRRYLERLLARARGNVTQAAKLAGKERRALGKLIRRYGIAPTHFRG